MKNMIKIVAFLQNQWFKNPERMEKMYESWKIKLPETYRERWIRTWLFYSCLTGKRLKEAFGEDLCNKIIWDEVSSKIGGDSSSCFNPDPLHIKWVIQKHNPSVVLVFGNVAQRGVSYSLDPHEQAGLKFLYAPHPAARGKGIKEKLAKMNVQLKEIIKNIESI